VPVLRIDEKVSLFESNAIAEYLDETTEPRLHPNDPALRAINRAWTDYVPTFANLVTAGAYAMMKPPTKHRLRTFRWPSSGSNWRKTKRGTVL
jgi:glutathione S-transferase